jgi:hypothetical protein
MRQRRVGQVRSRHRRRFQTIQPHVRDLTCGVTGPKYRAVATKNSDFAPPNPPWRGVLFCRLPAVEAMSKVRPERLKRDQGYGFRSRLHRHANGRGCSSQFYRFGFANPVVAGMERRRWPSTRERLWRLVLSASWVSNLKDGSTQPPEALRLEIRSGRFLMRQRRCLGRTPGFRLGC